MTTKWLRMCGMYERFAKGELRQTNLDYSSKAKKDLFIFESRGEGKQLKGNNIFRVGKLNAFAYGKWLMDITVAMWTEDLDKYITKNELLEEYPKWFIDKVLK